MGNASIDKLFKTDKKNHYDTTLSYAFSRLVHIVNFENKGLCILWIMRTKDCTTFLEYSAFH